MKQQECHNSSLITIAFCHRQQYAIYIDIFTQKKFMPISPSSCSHRQKIIMLIYIHRGYYRDRNFIPSKVLQYYKGSYIGLVKFIQYKFPHTCIMVIKLFNAQNLISKQDRSTNINMDGLQTLTSSD